MANSVSEIRLHLPRAAAGLVKTADLARVELVHDIAAPWFTPRYLAFKPLLDTVLATLLLLLAAPVVMLGALLVRLTSRGPAFYTQDRVGRDGQPFVIYKL